MIRQNSHSFRPALRERRPRRTARRGAAVVEMALIAPLLFMLVLGIVEFGRALSVAQLLTNAARDAARQASVGGASNSSIEEWVRGFLQDAGGIKPEHVTVIITVDNSRARDEIANAEEGDRCTIQVEVPFNKVQYTAGRYLTGRTLSGMCSMRHE